jgi:hypothetical protein
MESGTSLSHHFVLVYAEQYAKLEFTYTNNLISPSSVVQQFWWDIDLGKWRGEVGKKRRCSKIDGGGKEEREERKAKGERRRRGERREER